MADIITDYLAAGWSLVPVPHGTKGPRYPGWNTKSGALASRDALPDGCGVGLGHAFSGTMALDIDDWMLTRTQLNIDELYAAPDSVTILSGKPGRGKLLYRMPFGLTLPTKQFKGEGGVIAFELRCATVDGKTVQDILPPSIHPDTQRPYEWGGNGHWTRLPMVPQSVLDIWYAALTDVRPVRVDGVDSSWEEITAALEFINPDCSRDDWVAVGMALHWAGDLAFNSDQAYAIWHTWSQHGTKYKGERDVLTQWNSFRTDKSRTVTLGSLFHLARQAGWVRPSPDASTLFGDISEVVSPGDILKTLKPQPPDINLSLWPGILARRAQEVSDSVGCDPIAPLWAGLAAVCGVVDAQSRLELMQGFKVPPVLWLMTIGDPGDRKSPGSRPMLEPIKGIEAGDRQRYKQAVLAWEGQEAAYSAAKKAYLNHAASATGALGGDAPVVPPLPDKPVPVKVTVSDITSQELVRKGADRPRGMLCYLDEMNSWVGKLVNPRSGEDRSAWVVGFEAERYEMDRVAAGPIHAENFALSIYGNMQPQVLDANFVSLATDGLLQRFLPAVLRHDKTRMGQPIPSFMTSESAWENTLRLTYALPVTTYHLTPEAFTVFRTFQSWYEDRMKSERLIRSSPEFITAFSKITGLVGRLALIFHVIEAPFTPTVSADVMQRVVRIVREYVVPSYRYVFDREGGMSTFDGWLIEYVIQHADQERVSLSDARRSARRQFEKAGIAQAWTQAEWVISGFQLLESMKWLGRADDGSQESRGHAEWLVNPHLKTMFADYRAAVVKAKIERNQERLDKAGVSYPVWVAGMTTV